MCGRAVKLRSRREELDWSRGCILSSRSCGDTTDSHGPLQRLLGDVAPRESIICHSRLSEATHMPAGPHKRAKAQGNPWSCTATAKTALSITPYMKDTS